MLTVRIQEKNYSESIMVLKLKDGFTAAENRKRIVKKEIKIKKSAEIL